MGVLTTIARQKTRFCCRRNRTELFSAVSEKYLARSKLTIRKAIAKGMTVFSGVRGVGDIIASYGCTFDWALWCSDGGWFYTTEWPGHVSLAGNPIGPEGGKPLASVLDLTLIEALDLRSTNIDDNGACRIADRLEGSRIWSLDLSKNDIEHTGKLQLVQAFRTSGLRTLNLAGNRPPASAKEVVDLVKELVQAPPNPRGPRKLMLSHSEAVEMEYHIFYHINKFLKNLAVDSELYKESGPHSRSPDDSLVFFRMLIGIPHLGVKVLVVRVRVVNKHRTIGRPAAVWSLAVVVTPLDDKVTDPSDKDDRESCTSASEFETQQEL